MMFSSTIRPNEGEQYSAFVFRAHNQLLRTIPDPYKRNQAVWTAWESAHGDPVADRASEYFPPDKYRYVPKSVCYFREHTASKPGKKPRVYDFNVLASIVDAANEKCDSDSYSAIASHHNGPLKGPDNEPVITGYMGEHRLGMIGRNKPIFAVFVDEYHDKQHAKMFDERRRRSVEVLQHIDGRPPFFDPVALLGSEPPRLPLPVAQYQADPSEFESYSYVSDFAELDQYSDFSQAGGSNTFISGGHNRRDNYQEPSSMNSSLTPEDISAITNALMATPQMQFVSQMMEQGGQQPGMDQPGQQPGMGQMDGSDPGMGQPAGPMGQQPGMGSDDLSLQDQGNLPSAPNPNQFSKQSYMNPLRQPPRGLTSAPSSMAGGSGAYSQHYSATSNGDDDAMSAEHYAALENEFYSMQEKYSALESNNSKLVKSNMQMVEEVAKTRKMVAELQARNEDSDREMVIRDLYSRYPHFVVPDEELDRCLYSRGSQMSSEEFQAHVADVDKYAKRSPVATAMVPAGSFGNKPVGNNSEAQIADIVVEKYSAAINSGNYDHTYESIEAEVRKSYQAG